MAGEVTANSANKDLIHLGDVLKTVNTMKRLGLELPLGELSFKEGEKQTRPPFSEEWIRTRLLAPGALDGLTPQQIADSGLLPSVEVVLGILLKHVIVNKVIWEKKLLLKGSAVAADGETDLVFSVGPSPEAGNSGVRVNNATIVVSNFWARNGLLHIIDEVIQ